MTVVPTPDLPQVVPLWAREPAKIVGWIVTVGFVLAGGLLEILNEVADLLPEGWKVPVRSVAAALAGVVLVASRLQTWMTRNGVGPAGNGKDGVWSQASVAINAQIVAAQAATPEAIEAALAPKLVPPEPPAA